MEYNKIISVTGMPGLYELITSKNDGAIVRSLEDKSTRFVSSRAHNFSHLESIEVFTISDNINLAEIFLAMDKVSEELPDGKDTLLLKQYFEKVYPEIDFERVYASDLKKMVKWYGILKKNNIEIKLPEVAEESAEEITDEITESPAPNIESGAAAEETSGIAVKDAPVQVLAKDKPAREPAKKVSEALTPEKEDKAAEEEIPAAPAKKRIPKKKKED